MEREKESYGLVRPADKQEYGLEERGTDGECLGGFTGSPYNVKTKKGETRSLNEGGEVEHLGYVSYPIAKI